MTEFEMFCLALAIVLVLGMMCGSKRLSDEDDNNGWYGWHD